MSTLSKETLEAIVKLQRAQEFEIFMAWLRAKTQELTRSALRTAMPQICGAANELQDLVEKLDSARVKLTEMTETAENRSRGSASGRTPI